MSIIDFEFAWRHFPEVLKGVPVTLLIAVISMILGIIFGLIIALCRIYKVPIVNRIVVVYVSFIRGVPMIVLLFVLFYGIPALFDLINKQLGWSLDADQISPVIYAMIAYTLNTAAYQSEIFRASINATHSGQMEAAYSVGMTTAQALRRIILPQALVLSLPNLGNTFIGLIKATSLAFAVKVIEIMGTAKIIANDGYKYLEMYLVAAVIYWMLCFVFEVLFAQLERKMRRYEARMDEGQSA
ncbi:amino acid ABC transporter permease [Cytobacillus depressus]|uniref:Amino acid ABC transporter permease n=1 Tax=Cytobacillus depressus TaxID=1602942 RepID=A0A6L3V4X7_9BACI|nr:amino acid ABC transporter permease [Cytobacillus depressus]KAB2330010.1 amino acid ABC transporter permease [Cytobacillus depressus]